MKKAYKSENNSYYVANGIHLIGIYQNGETIQLYGIDLLHMVLKDCTECDLSEAVAAFDKVVKSLKDKMI